MSVRCIALCHQCCVWICLDRLFGLAFSWSTATHLISFHTSIHFIYRPIENLQQKRKQINTKTMSEIQFKFDLYFKSKSNLNRYNWITQSFVLILHWMFSQSCLKPNTHRRRRRDETVLSRRRRRCVHEFATTTDGFERTTQPSATSLQFCSQWVTTADGCVHTDDTTRLSPTSCEFVRVHTADATRLDSFVSSASAVCIGLYRENNLRRFTLEWSMVSSGKAQQDWSHRALHTS